MSTEGATAGGTWLPVGATREWPGALGLYRSLVAEALGHAEELLGRPEDSRRLGEVALSGGLAGIAVLADTVTAAPMGADGGRAAEVREASIVALWRFLERSPEYHVSLLTGHSGLLWTLADCAPRTVPGVTAAASRMAASMEPDAPSHFDLVFGTTGVLVLGRLLARTCGDPSLAEAAASWLAANQDAPGTWRTPRSGYRRRPPHVAGEFYHDWGVAHGIPGAAACLARFEAERRRFRAAAGHLARSRAALPAPAPGRPRFPTFTGERGVQYGTNQAWCYGDCGAASALALAAVSAGLASGEWPGIAARALERGLAEEPRMEPGICHGVAGLLLLACRLYNTTRQQRFADLARALLGVVRPGGPELGAGFLRGAAGVALTLHAALSDSEPRWDMVLCLS
ncbi:hypothetical protein FHX82_006571 [Amycolatopsis bartoniae]|uniref:Lanthionine synthetase n=1 Tax=Amycolatopsis bartoniae TaxID=941986 RepID=A0A8H9IVM3_9PSEU|nr:lanthionine synthetase LanC family protein [Amycolatopsis bartoniae]MBB2939485.1 hypothetical protein [Amycolatopsis bartoniae]TVT11312.1 hypothetical protein FNH07_02650 [Amycolatopsis bartoniae]GHF66542.1 hypothetical protein GCM10017566_45430 [Amycolatopsis bartoniae]